MLRLNVVDKTIGAAVRQKLRELVLIYGVDLIDPGSESKSRKPVRKLLDAAAVPWHPDAADPQVNLHIKEVSIVFAALDLNVPHELLRLAGKTPAPLLFEKVMRGLALRDFAWGEAVWGVETWAHALHDRLPEAGLGLAFGQPQQDRKAYLALKKVKKMPPLPLIEAKIKKMFGITLARTKVEKREGGYRHTRGDGCDLRYSFEQADDGREYLSWSHEHRCSMAGAGSGIIYEDGEEA